jgi:hypothetical protein
MRVTKNVQAPVLTNVQAGHMEPKSLYSIRDSYEYLERQISTDALYAIAQQQLVPVVRIGAGKILYPKSSLDQIASGQIDLTSLTSRRNGKRNRRG